MDRRQRQSTSATLRIPFVFLIPTDLRVEILIFNPSEYVNFGTKKKKENVSLRRFDVFLRFQRLTSAADFPILLLFFVFLFLAVQAAELRPFVSNNRRIVL